MSDSSRPELPATGAVGLYTTSEVEARTGVPATTLRQWERRYGIPRPERSASGYRLYSDADLSRIEFMLTQMAGGVSISRAAALAQAHFAEPASPAGFSPLVAGLLTALLAPDHARAAELLAQAHAEMPVELVLTEVIAPVLREIGELWERGEITVAHEHQASAFLRGRVTALMDAAGQGDFGPLVVAACGPGEHHEIGLLMLSTVLRRQGLRVHYMGPNTPLGDLAVYARQVGAEAVLVSVNTSEALALAREQRRDLGELAGAVLFGGSVFHAEPALAARLGGVYAGDDAVSAARRVIAHLRERGG